MLTNFDELVFGKAGYLNSNSYRPIDGEISVMIWISLQVR